MEQILKFIVGCDPPPMIGSEKGSFAYISIKDRLPVIVTNVVDLLSREKITICEENGENALEDIKYISDQLCKLKNEVQANEQLNLFTSKSNLVGYKYDDTVSWNEALELYKDKNKVDPKWFEVNFLFSECYFYKRVHDSFMSSNSLKTYDPFYLEKTSALENATGTIKLLCDRMKKDILQSSNISMEEKKIILFESIEICLWGNQWDLSVLCENESEREDSLLRLEDMRQNLMACDLEKFWQYLIMLPRDSRRIAFILDNAGPELFGDLCLAATLLEFNLVDSVTFYPKTRPWFISDTTTRDFNWTLQYLRQKGGVVNELSQLFDSYIQSKVWDIKERSFWTTHFEYFQMKKVDAKLYKELQAYSLIVVKGDLNYQKLVGSLKWPNSTSFRRALRGFMPSPMLLLRTIKGAAVVGLDEASSTVKKIKENTDWNTSGEFGIIQFVPVNNDDYLKKIIMLVSSSIFILLMARYLKKRI